MVEDECGAAAAAIVYDDPPGAQQQQQQQPQDSHRDPDASAVVPSQAVPVVGVPNYPNCIAWSQENLLAVGAGHLVTILDPASMSGPRGFIPVATSPVFGFGRVKPEDLKAHSLFEICLARDPRPGVRTIDWSPPGLAQNGGSLLAMCTTDGRAKVYREPFCDFQSEWVEVVDLSEIVFKHCLKNDFRDAEQASKQLALEEEMIPPPLTWGFRLKRKLSGDEEPPHRKVQKPKYHATDNLAVKAVAPEESPIPIVERAGVVANEAQATAIVKGSRVEVLEEDDGVHYWVGGLVAKIANGEALVELDRPQYGAMEEWVQLQGMMDDSDGEAETGEQTSGTSTAQQRDGRQVMQTKRPRIRPERAIDTLEESTADEEGGERSLASGEAVEAWVNDRWQDGMVVEVQERSSASVSFSASSATTAVELSNLRLAPLWHGRRWIWRPTAGAAVPNQKTSVARHNGNDECVSSALANAGQDLPNDSPERQCGGQGESPRRMRGQVATTLALYIEQNDISCPPQSPSGRDFPPAATLETPEKPFARVYKRRGPAASARLPADAVSTEVSTGRPIRSRRLPSKLRAGDTVSWTTEADGLILSEYDLAPGNEPQEKDGDYLQQQQRVKGVKDGKKTTNKTVRPVKDSAAKAKDAAKHAKETTGSLKEAECGEGTEKEKLGNGENSAKPMWISPHDYAARSEFLTPLSLAWSPKYQDRGVDDSAGGLKAAQQNSVLLGAGMKSGRVSLWRMAFPPSYSVDHSDVPMTASFLGFLFAHTSWVNTLSWASCSHFELGKLNARAFPEDDGPSEGDTLLLATGCADGSVKLWAGLSRELTGSDRTEDTVPFVLLREVVEADCTPVTALALSVPPRSGDRALLAVGKGSGSVGIWELKSSGAFHQICLEHRAHQQMVTGFSWTADGRSLYSCGEDSLKRWDVSEDQLLPLPFPDGSSVFPPSTTSDHICSLEALESFYGISLSPNDLTLATVRGIASDLLDQMYQARSQKGMVQLFWLGSEHVDVKTGNRTTTTPTNFARPPKRVMSGHEKVCWELNLIDALEALQDPRKPLVLWDLVAALSSLKEKLGTKGVVTILSKWLSGWAPGQGAVGAVDSQEWANGSFQKAIPKASCRRLQLMNVLYRRLFLSHVKTDLVRAPSSEVPNKGDDDAEAKLWKDGLYLVEHELRQRLVHINLHINSSGCEGLTNKPKDATELSSSLLWRQLLVEWVLSNVHSVDPQLGKLATKLQNTKKNRFAGLGPSSPMEACTFCDSSVALESPEVATCFGSDNKHRLQRCSVSMQVCPPVLLWHCSCCGRSAVKLASSSFFALSSREQIAGLSLPVLNHAESFPSCPFCGILMHRLLPNFLLTPSLV